MKIRFTPQALLEFREIFDYIESRSPGGARNVSKRVEAVLDHLLHHPLTGTLTDLEHMRRIKVQPYPYLIFYTSLDQEIIIVGMRHAARDPASMPDRT